MEDKSLEKMYLQEYRQKIFEEFKKATEIDVRFDDASKWGDSFNEWIGLKKVAASYYVKLFDYMKEYNDLPTNVMAEFNKG